MVNTAVQALAKARQIYSGYGGYCLKFVQDCYGAAAKYPSAIAAWNASQHKHVTSTTAGIPLGAPIYMTNGGKYGHVAIYAGNDQMITTNSITNKVGSASVRGWVNSGYRLLGWTSDIEGQMIPGLAEATSSVLLAVDGSAGAATVRRWQQVMRSTTVDGVISGQQRVVGKGWGRPAIEHSLRYGRGGSELIRRVQSACGVMADGLLGPDTVRAIQRHLGVSADGWFGAGTVRALQQRLNTGRF
jgi:hypothetical protein